MDVATWNVNSLLSRLDRVLAWLERRRPDVVCLQETKCGDDRFPRRELEAAGYQVCLTGEKGRNGVAILSRHPLEQVCLRLPGHEEDEQRRFVKARVAGTDVLCVYVPNGQAVGSDAFFYKLDWLSRLQAHLVAEHDPAADLILAGDFNIAPDDRDVYDPPAFVNRLHCTAHERRAVQFLLDWGLVDALRLVRTEGGLYSWFDYAPSALKRNRGLRIDLVLVTRSLAARVREVEIDLEERRGERPSDHAPVVVRLA